MLNHRLSIAPMIDVTDRHFRYFMRLLTRKTQLYTEMITTGAILHGDRRRILDYSTLEQPLVIQLGGDDAADLAECARIAADWQYSAINLNVGCPSDRVQQGSFGACLMADPGRVARAVEAMQKAVSLDVSVKCRLGIRSKNLARNLDSYEDLAGFVKTVSGAGCRHFIVHARIAILEGLSPAQNRQVPPIRYEDVYRLKQEFNHLDIEINGEITSLAQVKDHLEHVDACMIGRAATDNPLLFCQADDFLNGEDVKPIEQIVDRDQVANQVIEYVEKQLAEGSLAGSHLALRHVAALFKGQAGSRIFRRTLAEQMPRHRQSAEALRLALKAREENLQLA